MSSATKREDITTIVDKSSTAWSVVPLPDHIKNIPSRPFGGLSKEIVRVASPHLLAHILRTSTTKGVQVLSPRGNPMLGTIVNVRPTVRSPDHIVVTTQAAPTDTWPTMDGRSMDHLLPDIPNSSAGAPAAIVDKTITRKIGANRSAFAATDPISRAVVVAASVIDIQRRDDVKGDADILAEMLDTAWNMPLGTFGTLAPIVLGSSTDLLRTAISSDHNAPDALLPVHFKKFIHVNGGLMNRDAYGEDIAIDWARQRAIAKAIFAQSGFLEGMSFFPTRLTYAASDLLAPVNHAFRDKFLVFQPCAGSAFSVETKSFQFVAPARMPERFKHCTGLASMSTLVSKAELAEFMDVMVKNGFPVEAAENVKDLFSRYAVRLAVIGEMGYSRNTFRSISTIAIKSPVGAALKESATVVVRHMESILARGARPDNVIRSRIYQMVESVDVASIGPTLMTIKRLRKECTIFEVNGVDASVIKQLAGRASYTLGKVLYDSLALEAGRCGDTLENWYASASTVLPAELRCDILDNTAWAIFAVWNLWTGRTAKWEGSLKCSTYEWMKSIANSKADVKTINRTFEYDNTVLEAAKVALAHVTASFAPYYEMEYDVFALLSKMSPILSGLPGAVKNTYVAKQKKELTSLLHIGTSLWTLRARILRSAYVRSVDPKYEDPPSMFARICYDDEHILVCIAPTRSYSAFRTTYDTATKGLTRAVLLTPREGEIISSFEEMSVPMVSYAEDYVGGGYMESRIVRYVMDPGRFTTEMNTTLMEAVSDVAAAIARVKPDTTYTIRTKHSTSPTIYTAKVPAWAQAPRPASITPSGAPVVGATVPMSANIAAAERKISKKESGFTILARIHAGFEEDTIMNLEDAIGEEGTDEFLSDRYENEEEFTAALNAIFNEDDLLLNIGGTSALKET